MSNLIAELDSMTAARHLLTHPFYQRWSAGELSIIALQDYAIQYYRHVEAFPRYLSAIHSRCADLPTRQALLENLIEEERGPHNHPELWLRFAEGLGVQRADLFNTAPRAETNNLVESYTRISQERAIASGLAALYVYESQMPAVADAKIEGLRRFYGITDDDALAFFSVHREANRDHASVGARLIDQMAEASPGLQTEVIESAREALEALWTMLDGMSQS